MSSKGACGLRLMQTGEKGAAPSDCGRRKTRTGLARCRAKPTPRGLKIPPRVIGAWGTPHTSKHKQNIKTEHLSNTVEMSSKGACGLRLMQTGEKGAAPSDCGRRKTRTGLARCRAKPTPRGLKIPPRVIGAWGTPHTSKHKQNICQKRAAAAAALAAALGRSKITAVILNRRTEKQPNNIRTSAGIIR